MFRHLLCGSAIILALTMAATAQTEIPVKPDSEYVLAATGMKFPASVGDFQRGQIFSYRPDGSDQSAGYNRLTLGTEIGATVYVFPLPVLRGDTTGNGTEDARNRACRTLFGSIEYGITKAHPDAVLVSEAPATLTQGAASYSGYQSAFNFINARFFGRNQVSSRSDTYLFCPGGGKWVVEYRIDYPVVVDAAEAIATFMRDLTLTITPESH